MTVMSDGGVQYSLNQSQVQSLMATGVPVLAHLNSNPQNGSTTESCTFIQTWNEPMRAQYVSGQAGDQASWGYKYMYGVFYPLCPGAISYDANLDTAPGGGTMLDAIRQLMATYN
jgi:hypothetical protein